jgi:hypothetical protein
MIRSCLGHGFGLIFVFEPTSELCTAFKVKWFLSNKWEIR